MPLNRVCFTGDTWRVGVVAQGCCFQAAGGAWGLPGSQLPGFLCLPFLLFSSCLVSLGPPVLPPLAFVLQAILGQLGQQTGGQTWQAMWAALGTPCGDRWGFPQEVLAGHGVRVEGPWGFSCGAGLRVHSGSLWWELFSWHCPHCSCASLGDTAHIPGLLCDCWGQQPGVVPTATY